MSDEQLTPTHALEASAAEHERPRGWARAGAPQVREMCARVGVGPGASVIDVGCGPVGALLELTEVVGPTGAVLGLDSSAEAVAVVRALVARQGRSAAVVVHGDVSTLDPAAVCPPGPFDATYLRCVLLHPADPVATLGRVAGLVRLGGAVLVQDLVDDPRYPCYDPPLPAVEQAWSVCYEAARRRRRGASPGVGRRLTGVCVEAGLHVGDVRGFIGMLGPPVDMLEHSRSTLLAARRAIIAYGLAPDAVVDALAAAIEAGKGTAFRSHFGLITGEAIARVPFVSHLEA